MATVERLKQLRDQYDIRSADKLRKAALANGLRPKAADLAAALQEDVARQVFAPAPRSDMKSAAEQPGSRLQADLMDFSKNAKSAANASHQYAVQITDVFTRQTWTKAVRDKSAAIVHPAVLSLLAEIAPKPGFTFSTDGGKEFANIALPNEGIHRVKDPANRNSLAVVDASMQQVKQAIATRAARGGGGWATNLRASTDAYNERYHSAVHGSPNEAAEPGVQQFMVLQDNAAKFQHNRGLVEKKRAALERGGAFRAPIPNQGRSFVPKYGAVRELGEIQEGAATVTDADGNKVNFKHAQPVPRGSPEVREVITQGVRPPRQDPGMLPFRQLADEIAEWLCSKGSATVAQIKAQFDRKLGRDVSMVQLLRSFPSVFGSRAGKWMAKAKRAVGLQTGQFRRTTGIARAPRLPRGSVPTEVVGGSSSSSAAPPAPAPAPDPAPAPAPAPAPQPAGPPLRPETEAYISGLGYAEGYIARELMRRHPRWGLVSLRIQTGLHYRQHSRAQGERVIPKPPEP
jgi:hypothetical protein